jgi:hypothetical protein|tara:strand:- start:553 stop:783 length:231 start_codon:yes stop_codon:yes gene_type:complete
MSKKDSANAVMEKETNVENNVEKKVDHKVQWEDARENLIIQLKDHLEKAEYHKTMGTKIQGVLEVNDQLFTENENK